MSDVINLLNYHNFIQAMNPTKLSNFIHESHIQKLHMQYYTYTGPLHQIWPYKISFRLMNYNEVDSGIKKRAFS